VVRFRQRLEEFINLIPTARTESLKARYEAKVESLDQRVKDIRAALKNKKEPDFAEALRLMLRFLGTPAQTWTKAGRELKTLVHSMIFEANPTYAFQTGFGTPSLSLPFRIKEYGPGVNCELVDLQVLSLHPILEEIRRWRTLLMPKWREYHFSTHAKEHKELRFLRKIAQTEDKLMTLIPGSPRPRPVVVEPQAVVKPSEAEGARAAVPVSDLLHGDVVPFI